MQGEEKELSHFHDHITSGQRVELGKKGINGPQLTSHCVASFQRVLYLTAKAKEGRVVSKEQTPPHNTNVFHACSIMNQKLQMCGAYEDPLYVHSSTWRAYFACVQKGIKCTLPDPALPQFQYIDDSYIKCGHMLISMQKWEVRRNVACPQHIIMDGSSLRCTRQGLIKPEMMSRQLTALLAFPLLTAQLAFLSLSLALLRTTQGCRNVVNCKKKAPSSIFTWRKVSSSHWPLAHTVWTFFFKGPP